VSDVLQHLSCRQGGNILKHILLVLGSVILAIIMGFAIFKLCVNNCDTKDHNQVEVNEEEEKNLVLL
jgi:hypothetical protein